MQTPLEFAVLLIHGALEYVFPTWRSDSRPPVTAFLGSSDVGSLAS